MSEDNRELAKKVMADLAEKQFNAKLFDNRTKYKPGELYQQLGSIKKHILKDLKADDLKDIRWPPNT